jgi:outer membrane protein assembly factor BamA
MSKVTPLLFKTGLFYFLCSLIILQQAFCQQASVKMQAHILVIFSVNVGEDISVFNLPASFNDQQQCRSYVNSLPGLFNTQGYATASVDSIWGNVDTTFAKIYLGKKYLWQNIAASNIDKKALAAAGFIEKDFDEKKIDFKKLQQMQQRLLNYYENNGYPFAKIYLDSITITDDKLNALLKAEPGLLYHIDSMRIIGGAKIANAFMQQYTSIPNGSLYSKVKLEQLSQRIVELPYLQQLQPADITMLGSGAILNLYLAPKKSSQFNFLLGILPAANQAQKFQLTADVNLNLKNALGRGENIVVNWQQLQLQSPRLNLAYQQPYIFKSKFGVDLAFDLFKKDSSFVQVNGQLGVSYITSVHQTIKLFAQWQNCFLLANGVDTNLVRATKMLPFNIDVGSTSFGVDYLFNKTDYRLNPRSGNEIRITSLAGLKTIKRNNTILTIKDPSFNYASLYDSLKEKSYQVRIKVYGAHYFPLGKQGTLKLGANAGLFQSPGIFRNELFQIGGYRLLRGFDEESVYATRYAVATAEYRVRTALNSYFFIFSDAGWVRNKHQQVNLTNNFLSGGLGAVLETKLGLLNISYAIGNRGDVPFNLRQASKIHFGYVNYF